MTPALIQAAVRLAAMLARENQALAALDLARAAAMLDDKQRAAEAFQAAQAIVEGAVATMSAHDRAAARDLAARLGALAQENRRLLERAIAVQGRVLGTIAQAARPEPSRYGARGAPTLGKRPDAIAISARA